MKIFSWTFNQKWQKSKRIEHIFLKQEESWLKLPFSFPADVVAETGSGETITKKSQPSGSKDFPACT
jgi:hypothetical protein